MHSDIEQPGTACRTRRAARQLRPAALLLVLAALPVATLAAEPGFRAEITPLVGYGFNGSFESDDASVGLDDDPIIGLVLNGRDSRETQWEIYYSRQETTADTSEVTGLGAKTDLETHVLQLGGTYLFDGELMRPYIVAGIGGTHFKPDGAGLDSDTFWSFSIGTGMQFFPERRWGIRLEARGVGTILDSDSELFCVSSGGAVCSFRLEGSVLWQMQVFGGFIFRF